MDELVPAFSDLVAALEASEMNLNLDSCAEGSKSKLKSKLAETTNVA